jgi:hypothetical protein
MRTNMKQNTIKTIFILSLFFNYTGMLHGNILKALRKAMGVPWYMDMLEDIQEATAKANAPGVTDEDKAKYNAIAKTLSKTVSQGHAHDPISVTKDSTSIALQGIQGYFSHQLNKQHQAAQDLATEKANLIASREKLLNQSDLDPETRRSLHLTWTDEIYRESMNIQIKDILSKSEQKNIQNPMIAAYETLCTAFSEKKPLSYFLALNEDNEQKAYMEYKEHIKSLLDNHDAGIYDIYSNIALNLNTLHSLSDEDIYVGAYLFEKSAVEMKNTMKSVAQNLNTNDHVADLAYLETKYQKYEQKNDTVKKQFNLVKNEQIKNKIASAPSKSGILNGIKHKFYTGPDAQKTREYISWTTTEVTKNIAIAGAIVTGTSACLAITAYCIMYVVKVVRGNP